MPDNLGRLEAALQDRYRIERELGAGGMATVYLAEDVKHRRSVAVKVLRPELAAALGGERFLKEIEVTANLHHPNILALFDSGEAAGLLYFVMPYVEGESLRQRLDREGRLPVHEVEAILREMADALAYAHEQGVVHRDIKPDNVLMSGRHILVADFGVAKAVSGASSSSPLTSAGLSLGTPSYMAPEQAAGESRIDHRADLYSFGAMGYELLTGRPPFTGDSAQALLAAHLTRRPAPLVELRPEVPAPLADVIMRCLEKDPAARWQRADDVHDALSPPATPARGTATSARASGSSPRLRLLAANTVLIVLALAAAWLVFRGSPVQAEAPRIVAVVPLATLGGDEATLAFSAGLVEVLASRLTELSRFAETPLWVIPPNEIREMEITSAARAREELNATLALTGTMQPVADGMRLTLNLVDAATLRQLRSTVVSAPLSDVRTWQDDAVEQALAMLDVRPEAGTEWPVSPEGGTDVGAAYELYVQGRGYLQGPTPTDTDLDAAIQLFTMAAEADGSYALAFAGLGEAYWRKYRQTLDTVWVAEAIAASQRALSLSDSLPQVWTTLALVDNGMGRPRDALVHAGRALEIDSLYTEAYLELSSAYQDLQDFDEAERVLQALIERRPYYWEGYSLFAYLRYVQGRYADAAELYGRAGELAPGDAGVSRNAGAIYFFLDRWAEARTMFERSIEAEMNPSSISNLGSLDYFEGDYEAAAERFRQAAELRARDFVYWRNLGDAYRQIEGRHADARAAYQRSLELALDELGVNPTDIVTLQNLAFIRAALGHASEAVQLVDRIEAEAGDDADMMFSLAQTLEEVGQRDRALHWIGEALARGYSLRIVESEPQLAGLRRDPRFAEVRAASTPR